MRVCCQPNLERVQTEHRKCRTQSNGIQAKDECDSLTGCRQVYNALPQVNVDKLDMPLPAAFLELGEYHPHQVVFLRMHIPEGAADEDSDGAPRLGHQILPLLDYVSRRSYHTAS